MSTERRSRDSDRELATIAEFNAATGLSVDERLIVGTLEQLQAQGWLTRNHEALPRHELDFLDAHSGVKDNRQALIAARVATQTRKGSVAAESMTVDQVAALLGVSTSRVRHRLSEGTVYSYPSAGRGTSRQIPYWQFHDTVPVAHLAEVLNALPDDFTHAEIRDFALNAEIDHPSRGVTVPLLDWLRDGGDPQTPVDLAAAQALVI